MSGTTNIPGVFVLLRNGKNILFVHRTNTGWKDGEYALPGGHVEDDETFHEAACREIQEECGIQIKPQDLEQKATVHRRSINKGVKTIRVDVWFEAKKWVGIPKNMEPDIHGDIVWMSLDNPQGTIVDYVEHGLNLIAQGDTYGEFGWS